MRFTALALVLSLGACKADTYRAVDGDSLLRNGTERLRIQGIDAPELSQPGGLEAKARLEEFADSGITCYGNEIDRYQRRLVKCTSEGVDVGGAMVYEGLAWSYYDYPKHQINAQAAKRGLWSQPNPIPPQQWRRTNAR